MSQRFSIFPWQRLPRIYQKFLLKIHMSKQFLIFPMLSWQKHVYEVHNTHSLEGVWGKGGGRPFWWLFLTQQRVKFAYGWTAVRRSLPNTMVEMICIKVSIFWEQYIFKSIPPFLLPDFPYTHTRPKVSGITRYKARKLDDCFFGKETALRICILTQLINLWI